MSTPFQTVFIPGLLCSSRLYEPVLPAVWTVGATTVADTRRDDSLGAIAERLLAGVAGPFGLVGLSMGGYVALEVMRQAPERVAALALLSTSARADTAEQVASRRQQISLVEQGRWDDLVEAAFPSIVCAANEDDEQLRARWRVMAGEVGPEAFRRQQEGVINRADSRELLADISCPTLVVHGTGDRLIDPENGEELAAGIPQAELLLLDRCGHSPTWERPDAAAEALHRLFSNAQPS